MVHALDVGRQQLAGHIKWFFQVFKGFDLDAEQRVNHRQIVSRIGKPDFGICIKGIQSTFIFPFDL